VTRYGGVVGGPIDRPRDREGRAQPGSQRRTPPRRPSACCSLLVLVGAGRTRTTDRRVMSPLPEVGLLPAETDKDAGQHWFHDSEDF